MSVTVTPVSGRRLTVVGQTDGGAPDNGSYVAGDVVFDATNVWVCVTGGSPGTWQSLGTGPGTITLVDANNIVVGTATGTKIGTGTDQKLGFYDATPIARRAGAAQAAVDTTAATQITPFGFATQAQADGLVTLANELRAWAVAQGFIKGAA